MPTFVGTCTGTSGSKYNLYLEYTLLDQDKVNNRSKIKVRMWGQADSATYGAYDKMGTSWTKIWIGGVLVRNAYQDIDFRNMAVVEMGTIDNYWVNHNSDGSLALALKGQFYMDANSCTGGTVSGTWNLTPIPRETIIGDFSFMNNILDHEVDIGLSIKLSGASHTLTFKKDGTVISTKTGITTSIYTFLFTPDELNQIYDLMPNSVSVTMEVTCDTFDGTGAKVGSTTSKTTVANLPDSVKPVCNGVQTSDVNGAVSAVGRFIQSVSRLKVDISDATPGRGATISSYQVVFDGVTYDGQSVTMDKVISKSGDMPISSIVTDSRGRTATIPGNINVYPYAKPQITGFSVTRCRADRTPDPVGEYVLIASVGAVSGIPDVFNNANQKNTLTYKISSKLHSDPPDSFETVKEATLAAGVISIDTSAAPELFAGYLAISSYDFELSVTDKFNTQISDLSISTGKTNFSMGKDIGTGHGKVWEHGAIDAAGEVYFNDLRQDDLNYAPAGDGSLAYWHSLKQGIYFADAGRITGQPSDFGIFLKLGNTTDFIVFWFASVGGHIHRLDGSAATLGAWRFLPWSIDVAPSANALDRIKADGTSEGYFKTAQINPGLASNLSDNYIGYKYLDNLWYKLRAGYADDAGKAGGVDAATLLHKGNVLVKRGAVTLSVSTTWGVFSFPTAFPTGCIPTVVLTSKDGASNVQDGKVKNVDESGFDACIGGTGYPNSSYGYIAIWSAAM